ncbi:hypothetical protein [Streptomyces sp. DH8]|uniref:hypothetical protein n=1 Tax=Streptomyces sp. DH8 TaxID=2857008 RepID=UPI001E2C16EE|nr:hypothetical protein [Streptomyces sp. DH8]
MTIPEPGSPDVLRDCIAEALIGWAETNNSPQYAAVRRPETVVANAYGRADAVLAALPPSAVAEARQYLDAAAARSCTTCVHYQPKSVDPGHSCHPGMQCGCNDWDEACTHPRGPDEVTVPVVGCPLWEAEAR